MPNKSSANTMQILPKPGEERPLLKRRVIYRLSDKGRRILEISKGISKEEVRAILRLSPDKLDTLRVLENGPKRAVEIPVKARQNLKRLVEDGFIIRTVEGIDAEALRSMREEGLKNREISERLEISLTTIEYWINKLNLEKRDSRSRVDWMRCGNCLIKLLERNDPHIKEGGNGNPWI